MQLLTKEFKEFKKILSNSKNIILQMHINPDGDAVGSSIALSIYLKKLGYNNTIVAPNLFPGFLKWMPNSNEIIVATEHHTKVKKLYENADLIIIIDFNSIFRAGDNIANYITNSSATKVLIDHHPQPDDIYNLKISSTKVSSTSELVYHLIDFNNDSKLIDKEIADCLYVGIMTDTGSFSFNCNRSDTYLAVASLMNCGVDGENIHRNVYDTYSENRMRLLGYCLNNRLVVLPEFATSYIYLTKEDLKQFNHKIGDTEGFVNYGLSIDSIRFTALFTERDGKIRISFRSKGDFDVNEFARANFNGGGHKNASGSDSADTIENTIKYFEKLLPLYQKQLKKNSKDEI